MITLGRLGPDDLAAALRVLREWPYDGAPVPLHPGDVGWFWRFGAEATAEAVRTWSRDGRLLALGMLDAPRVLRLALAPDAEDDEELAGRIADDLTDPDRVLPEGEGFVEARTGTALNALLVDRGWGPDDPWAPLVRDLSGPVGDCGLRVEVTTPATAPVRVEVQRAAFDRSTFTVERWGAMAAGPAYAEARCLVGFDEQGTAVAAATVWSAGPGRPGLLEPVGAHRDHRGRGHGRAISVAAAATLRDLGSSSAWVCTPASNVAAVAAYASAGFERLPDVRDLCRRA